jgi:hypothetical protein
VIIWFGEENDAKRHIKIEWLKRKYGQTGVAVTLASLAGDSLADNRSGFSRLFSTGGVNEKLIISGHGNVQSFMGYTAFTLFDALVKKGLSKNRFEAIYLLGCNIGLANQENLVKDNFLKDFGTHVRTGGDTVSSIKVYGPRGKIGWLMNETSHGSHSTWEITDVKIIVSDEEQYSFDAGMMRFDM